MKPFQLTPVVHFVGETVSVDTGCADVSRYVVDVVRQVSWTAFPWWHVRQTGKRWTVSPFHPPRPLSVLWSASDHYFLQVSISVEPIFGGSLVGRLWERQSEDTRFKSYWLVVLWNFHNFIYLTWHVSFIRFTINRWSVLSGVFARESKWSHTEGKCVTALDSQKSDKLWNKPRT